MSSAYKKWFLICVLVAYSIYVFWSALEAGHWVYWGWGIITLIAAIGIGLAKSWVENIIHCIAFVTVLGWAYILWGLYSTGWPYTDASSTLVALIPGVLTTLICIIASWFAYTLFHPSAVTE